METDILYEIITTLVTKDNSPLLPVEIAVDISHRIKIPEDNFQPLLSAVRLTLDTQQHFGIFASPAADRYILTDRWYILVSPCTDCKTNIDYNDILQKYNDLLEKHNALVTQIRAKLGKQ